mmetsp:Transcript_15917/g.32183  ORF Transcript_15917/g.32183 Transcript_15917/m.32183 type:complete len:278 (-) Transcript_15917:186-1019(-)
MSFTDAASSVPSWAQRANEPLVPALDLAGVKKDVQRDLKEIKKASDEIGRLAKKRASKDVGPQLLSISERTRERARGTSKRLRDALALATEGSADHTALTQLSNDFRAALKRFQQEAEGAAPAAPGVPPTPTGGAGPSGTGQPSDIEVGYRSPDTPMGGMPQEQRQAQEQLQAAALNDSIIQEREGDIANIHRTVQEVSEIFQDLALLVDEQGTHIDNIQTNIESASTQTARGVQQLAKASRSQKKNRGRLCCCAVTLLLGVVVLVLILKYGTGSFN